MNEPFIFKRFGVLSERVINNVVREIDMLERWGVSNVTSLQDRREFVPLTFSDFFTIGREDNVNRDHAGGAESPGTFKWNNWNDTPNIRDVAMHVASLRGADHLGQVFVSRMQPGAKVDWHDDKCAYYEYHHRMQICIQANRETTFYCEDQAVVMKRGEMWSFRNVRPHAVINHGERERIALVVDCLNPQQNYRVKT